MMCEEMISYVYDDIKTKYSDCIHMIAFEMNHAGINRGEKTNIGDDEKVRCVWAHIQAGFQKRRDRRRALRGSCAPGEGMLGGAQSGGHGGENFRGL